MLRVSEVGRLQPGKTKAKGRARGTEEPQGSEDPLCPEHQTHSQLKGVKK